MSYLDYRPESAAVTMARVLDELDDLATVFGHDTPEDIEQKLYSIRELIEENRTVINIYCR